MSNESPDLTTLDREALARMLAELQGELAQERANSLAAQEIASRALVQRKEQEDATRIFRAQWCELVAATSAGRHLSVMRAQQRAALEWITNARGYEIRFKALEPKLKDCEAALELHRRSAQLQEQVRKADACTECKGTGEIGYINQTELGPEGDSSECSACFGSGSQKMADKISGFIEMEYGWLAELCERITKGTSIPSQQFESESIYIARVVEELTAQLAVARAEVERLTAADNPEYDATDAASPAWWRGHDHTTKVFCALVNDILDGKDDGSGVNREPWASTRKRLLGLCAEVLRMSQEIARLEGEFVEIERELAEVKTDSITGPWWVSFEQVLSQKQLDAIGLSEDRGATVCITRLADAYTYSEQEAERQQAAFHQSLRAAVDAKGEVTRLRQRFADVEAAAEESRQALIECQKSRARWKQAAVETRNDCNRLWLENQQLSADVPVNIQSTANTLRRLADEMEGEDFVISRLRKIAPWIRGTATTITAQAVKITRLRAALAQVGGQLKAIAKARITIAERLAAITSDMPAHRVVSVWEAFRLEGELLDAAIVAASAETINKQPTDNPVFDYCKTDEHDKCSGQSDKLYRDGRLVLCACRCHWRRTEAAAEGQEAGDGKG